MTYTLQVCDVKRWSEFNEFEGEIYGELDDIPVVCYLLGMPVELWGHLPAWGDTDIVGPLVAQDGEDLQVDSVLPMRVDPNWAERFGEPPPLRVGDVIRVRGALMIEPVELDE